MYRVSMSGRQRRTLACVFAGIVSCYIGLTLFGWIAPLLFVPTPDSSGLEIGPLAFSAVVYGLVGAAAAAICWRRTSHWGTPEASGNQRRLGAMTTAARLIAIVTGLITGTALSVGMGFFAAIVPMLLIAGAILQPRFRLLGFWLMIAAAAQLSLWMLPFGAWLLYDSVRVLHWYRDLNTAMITSTWAISLALLVVCDGVLAREGRRLSAFLAHR